MPTTIQANRLTQGESATKSRVTKRRRFISARHEEFSTTLTALILKNGDTTPSLLQALRAHGIPTAPNAIRAWREGISIPTHKISFRRLAFIEKRYGLAEGHLAKIVQPVGTATQKALSKVSPSEHSALKWHLPYDFEKKTAEEQQEIIDWICRNVLACCTDYGKYQSVTGKIRYAIQFPTLGSLLGEYGRFRGTGRGPAATPRDETNDALPALTAEMSDLIRFMTADLPPRPYKRGRQWTLATANLDLHRFGELFGALSAAPNSSAAGYGVPKEKLTFGLLAFPGILDWFVEWKSARRGHYATPERSFMYTVKTLLRFPSGWIRQHPELRNKLKPIKGLISAQEIRAAKADWRAQCDIGYRHAYERAQQIHWVCKPVRDPFQSITVVLNAKEPLKEYKKIGDEIIRRMPDETKRPVEAAISVRSYLLFRLAIHLGFRQRNLRELLVSRKGEPHKSIQYLQQMRRGVLRWNEESRAWEVFAPAAAFKNSGSSYFRGKPYHQILPRVGCLYRWIDLYLNRHRSILLGSFEDPGTFFVKETRKATKVASLELYALYDAWMLMIQKFGIYNPYTKRGAIKGLLPHGPHCVRDILATHILKQSGSYDLASFAIQDTVESTMRHYARFLPHEKAVRVAAVVNQIWS